MSSLRIGHRLRHRWIAALSFLSTACAHAVEPIDLVFDLDWTLFSTIPADQVINDPARLTVVSGIRYRLSDGVVESLNLLRKYPHVRISVFSGGEKPRNEALLRSIVLDPNGPLTAYDILYKHLSYEHLAVVPAPANAPEQPRKFSERFKKNLAPYFPNLDRTVLIDDARAFAVIGQERNLYWVGPTYDFFETYAEAENARTTAKTPEYLPDSFEDWEIERHRIPTTALLLDEAIQADLTAPGKSSAWIDRVHQIGAATSRAKRLVEWQTRLPMLQGRCADYIRHQPLNPPH